MPMHAAKQAGWLMVAALGLGVQLPAAPAETPANEPPRVTGITAAGFSIQFETGEPTATKILLRESAFPLGTPESFARGRWGRSNEARTSAEPRMRHELKIGGLRPATRYYYRVPRPGATNDPPGWSEEYAVNTRAARGKTEFIRVPVRVLLTPNLVGPESLERNLARPEPTPPEDLRLYADAFKEASLFFWVNSRMKYWVDFDLFADPRFFRREEVPTNAPSWYAGLPVFNEGESWRAALSKQKATNRLYYGAVVCEAERQWHPGEKTWVYSGSGGGTYGLDNWPEPGRSFFLGGSDICWLTCHEFKHQVESQYHLSGLIREDDRMWFCHFATRHDGDDGVPWKWDTAADHGEHYGGLAWQLRHMTDDQYLRNRFGELLAAADRDGDGIPDDAPRLPLDEKRLGSNPALKDSDGDGLDDLREALASRWMAADNGNPLRTRVRAPYVRPGLNNPDSDGDGLTDARDPYPLYPFTNRIPRATIRVDGDLGDWTRFQRIAFRHAQLGPQKEAADLEIRACYDDDWLYYAFISRVPHGGLHMVTDQDADGYYVGNDNVIVELDGDGKLTGVRVHLGAANRWPYEADDVLFPSNLQHAVSSGPDAEQIVELAIPKRPDLGLDLGPGEEIGASFKLRLPGADAWVPVFEPGDIFDSVLDPGSAAPAKREEPARASSPALPGSLLTLVDWDSMAVFPPGRRAGMFSSTDPNGEGRDCGNFLRIEGNRYVLAEMEGPGVITRLWSANPQGQLRIELDGRPEPAVDALFKDIFEDRCPPFRSPIAAPSSGGFYSYWPIGFERSCRITVGESPGIAERRAAFRVPRPVRVPLRGVRELKLVVTDGGDGFGCDHADWGDARLVSANGKALFLSDVTERGEQAALVSSGQGWGLLPGGKPGPNGALGRDTSCEGRPLSINGKRYGKGLGSHAPAEHTFALRAPFEWFEAEVGVDDEALLDPARSWSPSVTFEVYADGRKVYDSGLVGDPKMEGSFDPKMFFYQINYLKLPPGSPVEAFRRDLTPAQQKELNEVLRAWREPGAPPAGAADLHVVKRSMVIPPYGTNSFLQLPGAGTVRVLKLNARSPDRHALRRAVLSVQYDGDRRPAVWCPLGDFFGCGFGTGDYRTLLMGATDDGGFYSYFPMPFARGLRMTLENGSPAPLEIEGEVGWQPDKPDRIPEGRFCAAWREEPGTPDWHRVADLSGRGNFVGLGLAAISYGGTLGYLEGNDRFIVDGAAGRALTGTGMEDCFNSGWYYEQGLVSRPLHALSLKSEKSEFGSAAGITSQIRFLLPDRIPFESSLAAALQHGVNNNFPAVRYATVAYWYQALPLGRELERRPARTLTLPRRMLVRPAEPPDRGGDGNEIAGIKSLEGAVFADQVNAKVARAEAALVYWKDISTDYEATPSALFYGWPQSRLLDDGAKSRGDVLLCRAAVPGAQVSVPFSPALDRDAEMAITLVLLEGPDCGVVEVALGATVLGRHDAYHETVRPSPILTFRARAPITRPPWPLVLRVVGKNASARRCDLGIYCVTAGAE